ncbi:hypothetical protein B0H10DRAFT_2019643 [Mycena sp. CBHHK59/15]|nr:hypothetical protein B0H10DRAFT_2019643 [Mycena sp. CBHHK59/15]
MSHGTPPIIPEALRPYNTYVEDPKWQKHFTVMWCGGLAVCVALAAPRVVRSIRSGRSFTGLAGVRVSDVYAPLPSEDEPSIASLDHRTGKGNGRPPPAPRSRLRVLGSVIASMALWSLPGINLNLGQMFVIAVYSVFAVVSIVLNAPLLSNPNRAGFLALAQLPPVFLFATKNSLVALLLGPGVDYTKLNYIHRWSARGLFLGAVVHGALWINNHLVWGLPILSQQKEASGVAALGVLCVIVLSSLAPVRRWSYSLFLVVHFLTFPAFFITICYHTIYAPPWIFPPLAFYGADLLLRLLKFRVAVANIKELGGGGMSLISIPDATQGWQAGQHVQLRVLVGARAWEAHPLSVLCAPPSTTCLSPAPGMLLAARACGGWSRAVGAFASGTDFSSPSTKAECAEEDDEGRTAHVILDGPYGGCTLDLGAYESVLLVAGGSGATFTLGLLDDLVGRIGRLGRRGGERTRRVEWVWCVRSFGAIAWFAPHLLQIALTAQRARTSSGLPLELRIRIYVTCLCDPDAVPPIPGCVVSIQRPRVGALIDEVLEVHSTTCSPRGSSEEEKGVDVEKGLGAVGEREVERGGEGEEGEGGTQGGQGGGGMAVVAAGPGTLISEAGNAVARANVRLRRAAVGGVDFCAEAFTV